MYDILLAGGMCPDYERGALCIKNVSCKDGKIAYIGDEMPKAKTVIDCSGKVISPGFIDIHMHEETFSAENEQYSIAECMLDMGVTTAVGGNCGHLRQPISEFKRILEKNGGAPINYMLLAGYNTCRERIGIARTDTPTAAQRDIIRAELQKELSCGACGISFGLEYDPGITYDEMRDAVDMLDNSDYLVSAHYRADCIHEIASVEEMVRFARDIKQNFQISHLSSCAAYGMMGDALACINAAMEENPRLDYDTYPYNAWSTQLGSAVFEDGCFGAWGKSYEDILLVSAPYNGARCTKELFHEARRTHPETLAVAEILNADEICMALVNKNGMIGSDGNLREGKGHPRAAGTFPRVLGKYVREEKRLSLIDALRKMTHVPAKRLHLHTKGQILIGYDADITVFDPDTVTDTADFTKIDRPRGILHVFISGKAAITNGERVNMRLGQFLSHQN